MPAILTKAVGKLQVIGFLTCLEHGCSVGRNKTSRKPLMQEAAAGGFQKSLHISAGFRPDHDAKQDADGDDCRDIAKVGNG
jgi:hypothetical protein